MTHKIWLMGGLGNQLFQINYGYKLRKRGFDVCFIDNLIKKSFITETLLSWTIHPCMLTDLVKIEMYTEKNFMPIFFSKVDFLNQWSNYLDQDHIPENLPKNIFGYFQDKSLQNDVFFKDRIQLSLYKSFNVCMPEIVAHLRFGDAPNFHQNSEYYRKALKKVQGNSVCICTDDQELARRFLNNNCINYYFSSDILKDDFKILVNAKIVIVAPSTFSWWAVKLSRVISEVYLSKKTYSIFGSPSNSAKINII